MQANEHDTWSHRIEDALARLKRLPPGVPSSGSSDEPADSGGRREGQTTDGAAAR
jgi:hypothetical protein